MTTHRSPSDEEVTGSLTAEESRLSAMEGGSKAGGGARGSPRSPRRKGCLGGLCATKLRMFLVVGLLLLLLGGAVVGLVLGLRSSDDDSSSRSSTAVDQNPNTPTPSAEDSDSAPTDTTGGTPTGGTPSGEPTDSAAPGETPNAPVTGPVTGPVAGPTTAPTPTAPTTPAGPAAPGTWEDLPVLPASIGEIAAGILAVPGEEGSYLVAFGEHPKGESAAVFGATFIFDLQAQTWTQGAARPQVGHHHTAQVYDNRLYVLGGLGSESYIQIADLVRDADGSVDVQWTEQDIDISGAGYLAGSASSWLLDGKIYMCGGIVPGSTTTDSCAIYDIETSTWSDMAAMPGGRNHAAACTTPDKLIVFGGRSGGNTLTPGFDDTQIYSLSAGSWSLGAPMPGPARGGMGTAAYYNGHCYVFGGEVDKATEAPNPVTRINDQRTSYAVDIYNVADDSWIVGTDMPDGRHGIYPVAYDNAIYVVAGGTKAANSQSDIARKLVVA